MHQKENGLYVVGVVSWGPKTCAHKMAPGVFSDIRPHLKWINETIQKVVGKQMYPLNVEFLQRNPGPYSIVRKKIVKNKASIIKSLNICTVFLSINILAKTFVDCNT